MAPNPWKRIRSEKMYNLYLSIMKRYSRVRFRRLGKDNAVHVLEESWDYLILLDACRLDMFREQVNTVAGKAISGGSETQEWSEWNFDGDFDDVVYIAGNPHLANLHLNRTFGRVPFHHVVDVWDFGWDDDMRTVPPGAVTDAAIDAMRRYPDKRMIIHYNQPHHPFIDDPELLEFDAGMSKDLGAESGHEDGDAPLVKKRKGRKRKAPRKAGIWRALLWGQVTPQRVWAGYRRNLELVWDEVERLSKTMNGRVVVTADHGNMAGEWMLYGHPPKLRTPQLVEVPWHVLKDEKRRPPSVKPLSDDEASGSETEHIDTVVKDLMKSGTI